MNRILFVLIMLTALSCKAQQDSKTVSQDIPPYLLVRNDMNYVIADSYNVKSGFSALTVYINESGKVEDFAINKMKVIQNNDGHEINFVSDDFKPKSKSEYPLEVAFYYDIIKAYIENLEIVKNDKYLDTLSTSQISFMVRFNGN